MWHLIQKFPTQLWWIFVTQYQNQNETPYVEICIIYKWEIKMSPPTVESINHPPTGFHSLTTGKDWKPLTISGGSAESCKGFTDKLKKDLITCGAEPRTPQKHWLAPQSNETGFPVKWPPSYPSWRYNQPPSISRKIHTGVMRTGMYFQKEGQFICMNVLIFRINKWQM